MLAHISGDKATGPPGESGRVCLLLLQFLMTHKDFRPSFLMRFPAVALLRVESRLSTNKAKDFVEKVRQAVIAASLHSW